MVPPVPTPPTTASGTVPSGSWASVSGPSQVRFSSTFHSESNCCGAKYPGWRPSSATLASASLTCDRHHLRAEGPRDRQPLAAHPVRHYHEHPVALDGRDHAHRVSGITAACLHDGVTRPQQPFPFRPLDHVPGDPGLDGPGRAEVLELDPDPVHHDQGRV